MHHRHILLEGQEHYQKRTWRNKTAILGSAKPLLLTVPLEKGKHQQMMIQDVRIADHEPWKKIHLAGLKTAYGKTAFFEEVISGVEMVYQENFETLWELNMGFLNLTTTLLTGDWKMNTTNEFHLQYVSHICDLRLGIPAGVTALPKDQIPSYLQVLRLNKTHLPNLSILDALCHLGPETNTYLKVYAAKLYTHT
jgi:hypothetical protein